MPEFSINVSAANYPRVRAAILKMANGAWYRGIIKSTATEILPELTRYAKQITHRLTGMLAESHQWEYDSHTSKGRVFVNPRAVGKRGQSTVVWAKIYGVYEHSRGGSHAFYARTLKAKGHLVVSAGMRALISGVPKV